MEVLNLGEQLDLHIKKYINDHAYVDKKFVGAIIGSLIGCFLGFLIFGLILEKKFWYLGFVVGKFL